MRVAIVDDDVGMREQLVSYLKRYEREKGCAFLMEQYRDGIEIAELNELPNIVFLDVEMGHLDGFSAARKIRLRDDRCVIIFITKLAQYAIDGYEVNALDYIVKPVKYEAFSFKMDRAVAVAQKNIDEGLTLTVSYGIRKIDISEILYVEVINHKLIFHLQSEQIEVWDSLKNIREKLEPHGFALCNVCYLVNLRHVTSAANDFVSVGKAKLKISRQKKKDFLNELTSYLC